VVVVQALGSAEHLRSFGIALRAEAPPAARVERIDETAVATESRTGFMIEQSTAGAEQRVHLPADLFACDDCLAEMRDPSARRYRYPFINCTECGPRYTLIRAMPYDRPHTTLERFELCDACAADYANPLDRRFHAQPLACASCGPSLHWKQDGLTTLGNEAALDAALITLRAGRIVALRGVGGYHLLCDAADEDAVSRLRQRKRRPAKPLAVLVPWRGPDGLEFARSLADLSPAEAIALGDSARPIVVARRSAHAVLAASIAPGLTEIALMLPYSPLLHLLLDDFGGALVATSGNVGGEPVLTQCAEASAGLAGVADGFLHHDRDIARPADDPVVRIVAGAARPLRLGRGTSPLEMTLSRPVTVPTLAVGAFQKNTLALAWGERVVVSPHIGSLSSARGRDIFAQVAQDLQRLYGVRAERIVHDAHPGFPNTRWARATGLPLQSVWHHHAHAAAVAGEFPDEAPLLCFTWDGVGLGPDKTLWGGEALLGRPGAWIRVASFRPFRLPGGERAARQPWRSALALCWESGCSWSDGAPFEVPLLRAAFDRDLNAPATTSVGRLFDAAAALLGTCLESSYEAEGPMRLEALCTGPLLSADSVALPLARDGSGVWRSDWAPLVPVLLDRGRSVARRAALFHATLARALCEQAVAVRRLTGVRRVGLGGGVFQNRLLSEQASTLLIAEDFEVLMPRRLPFNDAAISYGQIVEATATRTATTDEFRVGESGRHVR
jgi:hydrogenase maturation protein HypF